MLPPVSPIPKEKVDKPYTLLLDNEISLQLFDNSGSIPLSPFQYIYIEYLSKLYTNIPFSAQITINS